MSKKRKKQRNNKKKSTFKIFFIIFLFSIFSVVISYIIMQKEKGIKKEVKKETSISIKEKDNEFTFDQIMKKTPEKEIVKEKETIYEEKLPKELEHTEDKSSKAKPKKIKKEEKKVLYKYDGKSKPKLAIVIDDVSTASQKRKILNIGYKVGMAFLPPTKGHKNSAKIAQDLPFYIIHFPMQASPKFKGEEENTLYITDSYEKIEKRVKQLRQWYPNAIYTNNHTGSVFTKNDEAMDKLFKALKKYNFIFIDSKTSPNSVAKKYAKKYNMPYIVRNTFLDNKKEFKYIQNQLIKAINKAKKDGYAIAIGHPHSMTIKVLKESKHLLKGLELIYINELPYLKT